jgi:high-affinity iron transporter
MTKNLFSVPIFFIVFRETLEAAIIVSVLLGLAQQIVRDDNESLSNPSTSSEPPEPTPSDDSEAQKRRLIKRLRFHVSPSPPLLLGSSANLLQVLLGAALGFLIALSVGAAFIAVWFTKAADLWEKSEDLWEGTFSSLSHPPLHLCRS